MSLDPGRSGRMRANAQRPDWPECFPETRHSSLHNGLHDSVTPRAAGCARSNTRRIAVDRNRTEGAKHQVKGKVREVAGKVTGNKSKEISGNIEKNVGKVQKNVGEAGDEVRNARRRQEEERGRNR